MKIKNEFKIKSKVWVYNGMSSWRFVSVDKAQSDEIKQVFGALKRGWGSLPVRVTLGETVWDTSIFPDKKKGCYILPLKAQVRKKEGIGDEDVVNFAIEVRV